MRRTITTAALVLAWTAVVVAAVFARAFWFSAPGVERGDVRSIERYLSSRLSDAARAGRLGSGALVLIERGEVVAARGFGVADAETRRPVDPGRTLFQVASVSKAVTAWGVMNLVEDGVVALDDPVVRHLQRWQFPASDEYREQVTVRHLLSHTGGLDDGFGYGGFLPGQKVQTLEESLSLTKDSTVGEPRGVRVSRQPGSALAYSGAGYSILQLLIEERTGRVFAEYMRDSVLRPLGMSSSSFDVDTIIAEGRAEDLAPSFDRELNVHPRRRYTAQAAVALYATPLDLARFAQAFTRSNPVLEAETLKQMLAPQQGTAGSWGLGHTLYAGAEDGGPVVGHSGGTYPAWGAMVRVNPVTRNAFVLVVSGGWSGVNQLVHDWVYWETGRMTPDARRQVVMDHVKPAAAMIIGGAVVLVLWRRRAGRRAIPRRA
jgi:CubicO group peptidase (beta-lactamase class C family)